MNYSARSELFYLCHYLVRTERKCVEQIFLNEVAAQVVRNEEVVQTREKLSTLII